MSALSIQPTYPIFTETDGQPLENGYIWIGTANLDPQVNPINVYWDAALTQLAAQPIRTQGGYPVNSGTPARLYVNSDYSIHVMNKNGSTVYSAPAATERYSDVVVSGVNAEDVIYDPPFLGGVPTNVEAKLAQTVSVKDFGAVGDGVTDDTAAIQAALNSGALTIDGVNGTYLIDSSIEIPTNCALKNINLIAGTAGMNCVLVNTKSQFVNSSIVGTGTTSIIERGVYPATSNVTDVVIDADISNLTVGIQSAPVGGTLAQRWTITGYIHDIVGTTGASEGYGVLLETTLSCTVNVKFRNIKRHAVYLSAGSSYNVVDADVYGCEDLAVQIYSTAAQAESSFNTIRGNFRNLSQSAAYQGGAVGIIGKANNNTVSVNVVGSGTTSTAVYIEGSSGGPYPRQNIVTNCNITGSYLASVILSLNADGTVITNNTIYATWVGAAINLNVAGTATVASGGFVESNYINCTAGTGHGIINSYEYMYYIGLNQLSNIGGTRVVDYSTAQRRVGHSREYKGIATVTAVAAGGFGDVVVTMPDTVINATTMATVNGGTVSSVSSLTCLAGNVSGNTFAIRAFNGAAVPQDIDVFWSVIGD